MIEELFFGDIQLPGEIIRILLAFLGVGIASYYDVFNKRNVPNKLLYAFLGLAFLVDLVFYNELIFFFSLGLAIFFGGIGYLFYRLGQIGGADVIVIAALNLLLPIHPSLTNMPINIPFIFSVIVYSGVLFALHLLGSIGKKLYDIRAQPKLGYLLLLIPYIIFAWTYINSFLFSPMYFLFISILFITTVFFLMFKKDIMDLLAEEVPISQIDVEDIAAIDLMDKDYVEKFNIPRLLRKEDLERLEKVGVKKLIVYTKLPPFLPFILAGMIFAVIFGSALIM